jgi:hypothetical protein
LRRRPDLTTSQLALLKSLAGKAIPVIKGKVNFRILYIVPGAPSFTDTDF